MSKLVSEQRSENTRQIHIKDKKIKLVPRNGVKMPRIKRDTTVLNIKIATSTYESLSRYCEESGQTKTLAVERFLNRCLDEYFSKPESERKLY